MRRGITILSDIVIIVALLILISTLWLYTAEYFKQKHTLEAISADEAIQIVGLFESVLSNPDSCSSMSVSIPKGVRIYVLSIDQPLPSVLVIVKPAGAKLDINATANMLVTLGAPKERVKLVYDQGVLIGAAVMLNNTLLLGMAPFAAQINGDMLTLLGVNWTTNDNMIYFNYKTTQVKACSRWDSESQLVALLVSSPQG